MSLGSLVLHLAANTAAFTADLGKAAHESAKRAEGMQRNFERAGKAIGIAVTAAAGSIVFMTKSVANAQDELGKMSQRVGVSVESLSALKFAGKLADVSLETLGTGLRMLGRNMSDTQAGTGEAREAFKALGIDVTDSGGKLKLTEATFGEIAEKFAGMQDGAGKTALAMRLFGRSGADLIPMLNGGRAGLQNAADEARRFGLIVTAEAAKAAEAFNDNLTKLASSAEGLKFKLTPLIASVATLTEGMLAAQKVSGGFFSWLTISGDQADAPIAALTKIEAKLAKLRADRKVLAGDSWGAKFNRIMAPEDLAAINTQIAFLEKQKGVLLEIARARSQLAFSEDAAGNVGPASAIPKGLAPALANAEQIAAAKKKEAEAVREAKKAYDELVESLAVVASANAQLQEQADEAEIRRTEGLRAAAEQMRMSLLTEEEAELLSFEKRAKQLQDALDAKVITHAAFNETLVLMEEELEKKLTEIRARQLAQRKGHHQLDLAATQTFLGNMSVLMNTKSKELFEIGKVAAIADTAIRTHSAAMKAYDALVGIPIVGPALATAAASAAYAYGVAQVAAIRSQSFGGGVGGGATPTFSANPTTGQPVGTPGGDVGTPSEPQQATTIVIKGDFFTAKQVRELVEKLMDNGRHGGPKFA